MSAATEVEAVLEAYRRSRWTMLGHAIFMALCIAAVVLARRLIGLPPQVITTVFIVALVVFGRDIMVFFHLRSRLQKLRSRAGSS